MFGIYFGKYLVDEGLISDEQYASLIEQTKNSRVKIGLLAVEMGLMTEEQTEEVNLLQQREDRRFGDIAIEQGYLTEEDVNDLLDRQGDPYLLFIQVLVDGGFMTLDDIREELVVYRKAKDLSFSDLEAIKTGEIDRITPIFMKKVRMHFYCMDYIMLFSRNIVRFVDPFFYMEQIERIHSIEVENLAWQHITGDYDFHTILCGSNEAISTLANDFAQTSFNVFERVTDTLDASKEFLNCNNDLFAIGLKKKHTAVSFNIPIVKNTPITIAASSMFRVPYYISDYRLDLLICEDPDFSID